MKSISLLASITVMKSLVKGLLSFPFLKQQPYFLFSLVGIVEDEPAM
jgi:hypothetical protein